MKALQTPVVQTKMSDRKGDCVTEPIKTREEALKVMEDFRNAFINGSGDFSAAMDALEDFFLTDEQKEAMKDAEYKYALQIGIDPEFAKYFYSHEVF